MPGRHGPRGGLMVWVAGRDYIYTTQLDLCRMHTPPDRRVHARYQQSPVFLTFCMAECKD